MWSLKTEGTSWWADSCRRERSHHYPSQCLLPVFWSFGREDSIYFVFNELDPRGHLGDIGSWHSLDVSWMLGCSIDYLKVIRPKSLHLRRRVHTERVCLTFYYCRTGSVYLRSTVPCRPGTIAPSLRIEIWASIKLHCAMQPSNLGTCILCQTPAGGRSQIIFLVGASVAVRLIPSFDSCRRELTSHLTTLFLSPSAVDVFKLHTDMFVVHVWPV